MGKATGEGGVSPSGHAAQLEINMVAEATIGRFPDFRCKAHGCPVWAGRDMLEAEREPQFMLPWISAGGHLALRAAD
ncbi:hypothetical protein KU6B_01640 [Mameliella alba]|nr:hypothetical protein KU6B_01640 [Mameliella alba]